MTTISGSLEEGKLCMVCGLMIFERGVCFFKPNDGFDGT